MPKIKSNPCEFAEYDSYLRRFLCTIRLDNMTEASEDAKRLLTPYCGFHPPYRSYTRCQDRKSRLSEQSSSKCTGEVDFGDSLIGKIDLNSQAAKVY